jgi:hypothetical protein
MNVPLQLKQITQHTTQVAFSTSFLLGGCVVAGREEENQEPIDVDAGDDVIVEAVQYDGAEAASHAYHEPDAPVVMPLEMEDAPTTRPPTAAMSAPREPKERRSKQTQSRNPAADEEEGVVLYSYELAESRTKPAVNAKPENSDQQREQRPAKKAERPVRDPVAESFLRTQGSSSTYQAPSSGTRY